MTSSDTLLALAERCEQATGPDREIDADICIALGPDYGAVAIYRAHSSQKVVRRYANGTHGTANPPRYTGSLETVTAFVARELPRASWSVGTGRKKHSELRCGDRSIRTGGLLRNPRARSDRGGPPRPRLTAAQGRRTVGMSRFTLQDFVRESNRIEGIHRDPTPAEIGVMEVLLSRDEITIEAVCNLVSVFAPGHRIRNRTGLDVRVGRHIAPPGGPRIPEDMEAILDRVNAERTYAASYRDHQAYETLHPFTDGNGRSGRAIWLWQMRGEAPLGFLHHWYYQSLEFSRLPPRSQR